MSTISPATTPANTDRRTSEECDEAAGDGDEADAQRHARERPGRKHDDLGDDAGEHRDRHRARPHEELGLLVDAAARRRGRACARFRWAESRPAPAAHRHEARRSSARLAQAIDAVGQPSRPRSRSTAGRALPARRRAAARARDRRRARASPTAAGSFAWSRSGTTSA